MSQHWCENCSKPFAHGQSLFKHRKRCNGSVTRTISTMSGKEVSKKHGGLMTMCQVKMKKIMRYGKVSSCLAIDEDKVFSNGYRI